MIVKIEDKKNKGFDYFEISEFSYQNTDIGGAINCNFDKALWLVDEGHEKIDNLSTNILFLRDKNKDLKIVITTRLVYVLNENGKTIDTLY